MQDLDLYSTPSAKAGTCENLQAKAENLTDAGRQAAVPRPPLARHAP